MKKILNFIFSRIMIVGLLILFQLGLIVWVIWRLSSYFLYFYIVCMLISILTIIHLVSKSVNPSYKLAWTITIMTFPLFGAGFYILEGSNKRGKKFTRNLEKIYSITQPYLVQDEKIIEKVKAEDKNIGNQAKYIKDFSRYPIYEHTITEYLSPGEEFFRVLVEELEKAKHFIFMEYFIIQEGKMWDTILGILERKVKDGIEVRVMYDDIGSLTTLPYKYNEQLEKKGIKCQVFNRLAPVLNIILNNRDHRKITVIDGYIGFMGGINLADEYINAVSRFGHWKDAAIKLKGSAVWNLTMMFLQTWDFAADIHENYNMYRPEVYHPQPFESDGFVQPYGDSPLDQETVGENVYLNLLFKAKKYVYICTPYLIVDNEMVTALSLAAKSGVDIRIITPHKEDKWYVHILTRAYYEQLIRAGIKVYEYTPGFIHSKTFVSDDELGIVGSINMDYRSLYLHFECGTWLYKTSTVADIKKDFEEMLEVCTQITLKDCRKVKITTRLVRSILRLIAPLM
ncbi:MAG: cardiolipin synthase [Cellulosilyticum sp.]|nr:cardiolipin synthase [Cellulosilyticum sp.]